MGKTKTGPILKIRRRKKYERYNEHTPTRIEVWRNDWLSKFLPEYENPQLQNLGINIEEQGRTIFNNLRNIKQKMKEELVEIDNLLYPLLAEFNEENNSELTIEIFRNALKIKQENIKQITKFLNYEKENENKEYSLSDYVNNFNKTPDGELSYEAFLFVLVKNFLNKAESVMDVEDNEIGNRLNTYLFLPNFIEIAEKLINEFDSTEAENLSGFVIDFLTNKFVEPVGISKKEYEEDELEGKEDELENEYNCDLNTFETEIIFHILDFVYAIAPKERKEQIFNYLNSTSINGYGSDYNFYSICYFPVSKNVSEAKEAVEEGKNNLEMFWNESNTLHNSYVFLSMIINAAHALFDNFLEKYPELASDEKYNFNEFVSKFIEEFNNPDMKVINPEQDQQEMPPMEMNHNELGAK